MDQLSCDIGLLRETYLAGFRVGAMAAGLAFGAIGLVMGWAVWGWKT